MTEFTGRMPGLDVPSPVAPKDEGPLSMSLAGKRRKGRNVGQVVASNISMVTSPVSKPKGDVAGMASVPASGRTKRGL